MPFIMVIEVILAEKPTARFKTLLCSFITFYFSYLLVGSFPDRVWLSYSGLHEEGGAASSLARATSQLLSESQTASYQEPHRHSND